MQIWQYTVYIYGTINILPYLHLYTYFINCTVDIHVSYKIINT